MNLMLIQARSLISSTRSKAGYKTFFIFLPDFLEACFLKRRLLNLLLNVQTLERSGACLCVHVFIDGCAYM